jgi:hypothetical protein
VEFTISGRLRRRGAGMLCASGAIVAGLVAWLAVRGMPGSPAGPLAAAGFALLAALRGTADLRRARKPFRLRIDAFGLTLHDAEVSWEQVDAVALEYRDTGEDSQPSKPRLVLWTAAGVRLPRPADRRYDAWFAEALGVLADQRVRYTLLDTGDLDQPLGALSAALAEYGGAHFETAPRSLREPVPVTVSGPEGGQRPGQVFTVPGRALPWVLCLVLALACTEPVAGAFLGQRAPVPIGLLGPDFAVAAGAWFFTVRLYARWRRPRRLAVGPEGLSARARPGGPEVHFGWPQVAALTVGPHPAAPDAHTWLTVWPLPGTDLPPTTPRHLVAGHLACPLTPLTPFPPTLIPALHPFAGERLAPPT